MGGYHSMTMDWNFSECKISSFKLNFWLLIKDKKLKNSQELKKRRKKLKFLKNPKRNVTSKNFTA